MRGLVVKLVVAMAIILLHADYIHCRPQSREANEPRAVFEQKPYDAISITYQNGELSIDTSNAPLKDILRAVCSRTGALIDIPAAADERVTRHIGPGRVIIVLGSLLNETNYNYLIEELSVDQSAPVRVVLSLKGEQGTHTSQGASVMSAAASYPLNTEEADAQQKALSERSALLRQINDSHLQFVREIQKAQQSRDPEIR